MLNLLLVAVSALLVALFQSQGAAGQGLDIDRSGFEGANNRLQSQQAKWQADTASAAGLVQNWARDRQSSKPCTGPSATGNLCGVSSVTAAATATLEVAASPAAFDTRNFTQNRGLYLAPQPQDQGDCNACVAYAVAAASQAAAAAALQKNTTDVPVPSARQLFFCGPSPADCVTGWKLQEALQALDSARTWAKDGLIVNDCMPMSDVSNDLLSDEFCKPTGGCNNKLPDGTFTYTKAYPLYDVYQIQKNLRLYGASVVTRMTLPQGFKEWFDSPSHRTAVYDSPQAPNAADGSAENHAVVLAGYNNIEKWWLIWSSWGKDWADGGFAKVRYNQLGIADPRFTYGIIFKPKKSPPAINKLVTDAALPKDCLWIEVKVVDYVSRVGATSGLKLSVQQLLNNNVQRINSLSAILQPGQRLMVCDVKADCAAQENCYSCQQSPGCVWCYEPADREVKPNCQSTKQTCPRFAQSINECPIDNVPEVPPGQKGSVTCSTLSNCRECLRFTYQCHWCIRGVDQPQCQSSGPPCSSWYGFSPKECPRDGDPGATTGSASCADMQQCDWCLRYAGADPQCVWCSTTKKCMAAASSNTCQQGLLTEGPSQCASSATAGG